MWRIWRILAGVGRKLGLHLLMIALAVVGGLAAFEAILVIAMPQPAQPQADEEPVRPESPADRKPPSATLPTKPTAPDAPPPVPDTSAPTCQTEYVAVFDSGSGTSCARNPTSLMAPWGPPTASWFRRLGGEFRVQASDILPSNDCACFGHQSAYRRKASAQGLDPVERLIYEGNSVPISKWVCAIPCGQARYGQ